MENGAIRFSSDFDLLKDSRKLISEIAWDEKRVFYFSFFLRKKKIGSNLRTHLKLRLKIQFVQKNGLYIIEFSFEPFFMYILSLANYYSYLTMRVYLKCLLTHIHLFDMISSIVMRLSVDVSNMSCINFLAGTRKKRRANEARHLISLKQLFLFLPSVETFDHSLSGNVYAPALIRFFIPGDMISPCSE
jgi:hypothetical protein